MPINRTPEEEQKLREKLVGVSTRVFLREGYAAASMKALAEEAGCTTGRFYGHFTGKAQLLSLIAHRLLHMHMKEAEKLSEKEEASDRAEGYTYAIFLALTYLTSQVNAQMAELYEEALSSRELTAELTAEMMTWKKAQLATHGEVRFEASPQLCGMMTAGLLQGLLRTVKEEADTGVKGLQLLIVMALQLQGMCEEQAMLFAGKMEAKLDVLREAAYKQVLALLQA